MLQVTDLVVRYGHITAVWGVSLDVAKREIVTLIGANGAGKTSVIKAIAGLLPFSGSVVYDGKALKPGTAERNVRAGIALVPEGRGILGTMSVGENLQMGIYSRKDRAQAESELDEMTGRFPVLKERRNALASLLSGGEQQMLAIARALLTKPRLLLLDEPSLGLAPKMTEFVFGLIEEMRQDGLTVLLVEQKARQALRIADRAFLLDTGRVVVSGPAQELANDSVLSDAFLGGHAGE